MRFQSGDIFLFNLNNNIKTYFQFLGKDNYQLGSDCVVIFNPKKDENISLNCDELTDLEPWFVTHTWIEYGIKDKYYMKVCNKPCVLDESSIKFRNYQKDFYDERGLREIYYLRGFNDSTFIEFESKEDYLNRTGDAWDDGVMLAQGLKEEILRKLFGAG